MLWEPLCALPYLLPHSNSRPPHARTARPPLPLRSRTMCCFSAGPLPCPAVTAAACPPSGESVHVLEAHVSCRTVQAHCVFCSIANGNHPDSTKVVYQVISWVHSMDPAPPMGWYGRVPMLHPLLTCLPRPPHLLQRMKTWWYFQTRAPLRLATTRSCPGGI